MKPLILLAAAALLVGAGHPGKPAFEYKGFVSGVTVSEDQLAPCRPKMPTDPLERARAELHPELYVEEDPDRVLCMEIGATVAGMPVTYESVHFYKAKLSSVSVVVDVIGFKRLTDAFRAKYGPPCRSGSKKVQTVGGANIDSPYTVWCFASGELTANMYYPDLSTSTAEYKDTNQAPAKAPTVDF